VLVASVREAVELRWRELRAVEIVLEEVAKEFDGEDPATPRLRRQIEEAKKKVKDIREGVGLFGQQPDLPEPDEELLEQVRQVLMLHVWPPTRYGDPDCPSAVSQARWPWFCASCPIPRRQLDTEVASSHLVFQEGSP
jgi:hypothetical protein